VKTLIAFALLASSTLAAATPLTVRTGETWLFAVKNGEAVNARRVRGPATPRKGEFAVTVRPMIGTTMFITNNSGVGYTLRAELLSGGKAKMARACTVPATGKPVLESWIQKADAVRLSNFKPSKDAGSCP